MHLLFLNLSLLFTISALTLALAVPSPPSFGPNTLHLHLHGREHGREHNHALHSSRRRTRAATSKRPNPVNQLLQIAPTSNTCAGAQFPAECAVSSIAMVQAMVDGFAKYNVTTAEEQAALLSWMAFESGEFKFNHNHFPAPGRPGQGTRVMLMPNFVQEYAGSIKELKNQVAAAGTDPDKVLQLVMPDRFSFAAAAWYYGVHCTKEQKGLVRTGGQQGWESAFVTGCVGTTVTDERVQYWKRAREALGVPA
ncbi:hypothetical protein A1O1_05348 [Capronia coronata CBS 617.96]|uniref:Lysozyme n=1 Tax=Capronia coronata CBS 617.96 TaxID=1182541 RepID=W9Y7D4_9EURO|nr:uncharacterized protein A1O1_05348 [Capronia coronata CBS 617.96]EXJ88418.1 hypothetical protein A1O1_05348 [Capronia coronata CBS 617.96]